MAGRRQYDDPCGLARALDVVGERWALLVVRELIFGPKRFTDLHRGLPTASQNVLAQRLRELTEAGVVRRRRLGPPASSWGYELTEHGHALEPALRQLAGWGAGLPLRSAADLSVDALALALRTTFDPAQADDLHGTVQLRLGPDRFLAEIRDAALHLDRAEGRADATVSAEPSTLRAIVFGGRSSAAAEGAGDLAIEGDRELVARFLRLFGRPEPAMGDRSRAEA
ncbi:winged helix-turn-helix transcriptional regulator [Plantactinospora siamensis]|uniref:Winged helix-turn-helix transcriptional regulator n=1 Tax=Plantactinospora siamensis TaxID=555372 RepID=A0ABV6NYH8_9ACTN